MNGTVDLVDVNVWLALSVPDHVHHDRARRYWYEESAAELAFCRVTSLAFLRLSTQPAVMGGNPLTVSQAWKAYQALRQLPEVILAREPDGCEARLGTWVNEGAASPRLWTDAYLAAFAVAGGFRFATLDRDFRRFPDLDLLHLEA
jgi:uncharacterized protein